MITIPAYSFLKARHSKFANNGGRTSLLTWNAQFVVLCSDGLGAMWNRTKASCIDDITNKPFLPESAAQNHNHTVTNYYRESLVNVTNFLLSILKLAMSPPNSADLTAIFSLFAA